MTSANFEGEESVDDYAAGDGWTDAVAVMALQHAEVAVAELIGDEFDRHACVGHQARCRVAEQVRCPVALDTRGCDDFAKLCGRPSNRTACRTEM